jgi:ferrochelatase
LLAKFISRRRAPVAREIYEKLGGASPLLPLTREQASALERRLAERGHEARVFVSMRYWHPMSDKIAGEVQAFAPTRVILLPLYPQFSTTTTESSVSDWHRAAAAKGIDAPTVSICCYPTHPGFVSAVARRVRNALEEASPGVPFRLLFSAHGLPKRVIARGDPYQWQVERSVAAVLEAVDGTDMDHVVCYQSRVGPLEWIGPSVEEELARAAADHVGVVVVPIAFVSEHSETLVELDMEYRARATALGVPCYVRVPTVGTAPEFIGGLADIVEDAISNGKQRTKSGSAGHCPSPLSRCLCTADPIKAVVNSGG